MDGLDWTGWTGWTGWILLRRLVLLEHLTVLIMHYSPSPFCQFNQGNASRTFSHKRGFHFFPPGQTFNILQLREKYTINQILHRVVAVDASLSSQLKCSILHLKTLPPGKNFTSSCFSFFLRLATCCQDSSTSWASIVKDGL